MNKQPPSIQRGLGRVEARVAELSSQIGALRQDVTSIARNVETAVAGHQERIRHLEAFRKSLIGFVSAVILSGAAAVFAYMIK
ncbi:hypothetical protein KKH18_01315 [bacterium]|nr:hypothetical protein [bacterium]